MEPAGPRYLIREDICRENIRTMAAKASSAGVIFRPHFKTHQSRLVARWFRDAGVTRITVSSLGMAAYFQQDGWDDITVAFPVNLLEADLINELAAKIRLGLLIEDGETAYSLLRKLKYPAEVYIKIDTGYHRTGLEKRDLPELLRILEILDKSSLLTYRGMITHAGNTYSASSPGEIRRIAESSMQYLTDIAREAGIPASRHLLSIGDTPSCSLLDRFPGMGEIRPGNFIFYDLMQKELGTCSCRQIAAMMVCPVVAVHPRRNQAVIYGGAVHFSKERILVGEKTVYGQMASCQPGSWAEPTENGFLVSLSQEHGILEAPTTVIQALKPGTTVGFLPVHACLTANLMRGYYLVSGQAVDHF